MNGKKNMVELNRSKSKGKFEKYSNLYKTKEIEKIIPEKREIQQTHNTERLILCNQTKLNSRYSLLKYQVNNRLDHLTKSKIFEIEEKISRKKYTLAELVELDLIYQRNEMEKEHLKIKTIVEREFGQSGEKHFLSAIELYFKKMNEAAISEFETAERLGYRDAQIQNSIGVIHMRNGNEKVAEKIFQEAIVVDPTYEVPYFNLASIKSKNGKYNDAEKMLLKSLHCNPVYERPYLGLAKLIQDDDLIFSRQLLAKFAVILNPMYTDSIQFIQTLHIKQIKLHRMINAREEEIIDLHAKLKFIWESTTNKEDTIEELYQKRKIIYRKLIDFASEIFPLE